MTFQTALSLGAARIAARDAELLLRYATGKDRAFLLTHPDAKLTEAQQQTYEAWVARRERQEPVQYITGEQEFYGLTLRVTPDVLIPRPETEHLVEATLARLEKDAPARIADVGAGSGAIAIALAHELPKAQVTALDTSLPALAIARENAQRHGVAERIRLAESDLLGAVLDEQFDLIVSNPPYVPEGELLEAQVREYEPHAALFAGPDGLEVYRRLIPQAWKALRAQGWLLMEIGHGQHDALTDLLRDWNDVELIADLRGIPRVVCARRPLTA